MSFPAGTVTFLFTDIEGSTRLWEANPELMGVALAKHDDLLRSCIENHGGRVFKTIGDAFCAAFTNPPAAIEAAIASQKQLQAPARDAEASYLTLRVRMALHTGVVEERSGDYFGQPLNRVARLLAIGHGGQILLSDVAHDLCRDSLTTGCTLKPLGEHRLKDLGRPEIVFQLCHPDLPFDFPPLRALNNPTLKHNLPHQLTSFIGRENELDEIARLFEKTRLLTLTGAGGCGKTRLALQAAVDLLDGSEDGPWLVELAALTDPALVPQAVATALGIKEETDKPILQTVVSYLKPKHLLFVLDNCEHLVDACAKLADDLLRNCPHVQILATSREALGIAGETTFRVPSLSLPNPKFDKSPERLSQFESVRLFIDRACQVQPAFQVTNRNATALASLCNRLDGIPMAIELAAARIRNLSVEEVNEKLGQRFRLLTGGSRTALPRQQTLRSLIDWSYDLLSDAERALLRRISVFAGAWTLDAAEAVCAGEEIEDWETLDLLTSLVDKSLVVYLETGGKGRYRLLETVSRYASEKLGPEEEAIYRRRHREYFLSFVEEIRPKLVGAEQGHWFEALEADHDNLRQAMSGVPHDAEAEEQVLRLASALQRFWMIRGHLREGLEMTRSALSLPAAQRRTKHRADGLNGAAGLMAQQGDPTSALPLLEECLSIRRELGDLESVIGTLRNLGNLECQQRDFVAARALHEECLVLSLERGDRLGTAYSLVCLGNDALRMGELAPAQSQFVESLALLRELEDHQGIALALINLAIVDKTRGNFTPAASQLEEALRLVRELDNKSNTALCLNLLGEIAAERGELDSARAMLEETMEILLELGPTSEFVDLLESYARLARNENLPYLTATLRSAAEQLRLETKAPMCAIVRDGYDIDMHWAQKVLSDADFESAISAGRLLTLEQAMEIAVARP